MRATNLVAVLNLFTYNKPLASKEELDAFFVERPQTPLHEMEIYLRNTEEKVKILFTGHRGSDKSTELNRLALHLDDQFFIVKFSITESLNFYDLNYIDILLISMLKLLEKAIREKVKIDKGILEHVFNWLHHDITEEKVITSSEERDLSSDIELFVIRLQGKLQREAATTTTLRAKVESRLSELIDKINLTIPEIEEKTKKSVLIIIEDIDKGDLEKASNLFFQHGQSLLSINSNTIYTFPIALRHSNDFPLIEKTFHNSFGLSNITTFDRQGKEETDAHKALKEVIIKRAEEHLFTIDAIKEAIQLSGGLMIELIRLIQDAALEAMVNKKEKIDVVDIHKAATKRRNNYQRLLRSDQYSVLRRINEDKEKKAINEEAFRSCLHNLSLLEYQNGEVWVDVHPIVKPLL
ncbi:MAG: hypothetical protein QME49_07235 [bacterium]|nr:hypothetical protein [bacterium]